MKLLCFILIYMQIALNANCDNSHKSDEYRLLTDVIPEHYKLEILTHLGEVNATDQFEFDGNVIIKTNCVQPTKLIRMNTKGLKINSKTIQVRDVTSSNDDNSKSLPIEKVDEEKKYDFLNINLEDALVEDHKYEITISYKGVLDDGLNGFYRSSYVDKKTNEKKWLGATQFEATHARKAFPCFDEPAMKATFDISLGRKDEYNTISNMPILQTEPIKEKQGWSWDRYETSVPMSTYLVAFIVSDFGFKEADSTKTHSNVTFKIWARKDALGQVQFASEVGPQCLAYYEKFFDIPYPLPKQDMVALPDFSAGAMENWGLITYREAYLLYDPKISTTTSQHGVASVIAHELAHQWFGNLVTMKWWSDLWLNEGFATYMAAVAVNHLFPEWNSLEEEVVSNLLSVFSFDSLKTSHPVSVPIGNPSVVHEIFDTISYKKGALIIRMMSLFLGDETLRRGVTNYLMKHKYGNAEQNDLWEALTLEAHRNRILPKHVTVKTIMDTWTVQTGYPVLHVRRNYKNNTVSISQERYLRDNIKTNASDCWWVPLTYTTQKERDFNSTMPKSWMSCPQRSIALDKMPNADQWVLFNIQVAGIYKVNYDEENWKLLIKTLNSENYDQIPTLNRVQLLDDVSDLAWTGNLNYSIFFDLLKYLQFERAYLPWRTVLANIHPINRQLYKTSIYGNFKNYMRQLLTPIYDKMGGFTLRKTKALDSIKHQILIVSWSCRFDVVGCVSGAKELVQKWQEHPNEENPVPKDLRSVIYCTALRQGTAKEWNFIWQQYKTSNVATEKNSLLSALGCTREIWLLRRYLEWSLSEDSGIRRQDSPSVFGSVASNDVGYFIAKKFFYTNIAKIHKHFSQNPRKISRYLASIAARINDEWDFNELKSFMDSNKEYFSEIKQGTDQSLEMVKLNVQWKNRYMEELGTILKDYS